MNTRTAALSLSIALNVVLAVLLLRPAPEPPVAPAPQEPVVEPRPVPASEPVLASRVEAVAPSPGPAAAPPVAPAPTPGGEPITVSPGPSGVPGVAAPEAPAAADQGGGWLANFDRAMDREFMRLEEREQRAKDDEERATIREIKDKLTELDALWSRQDASNDPAGKAQLEAESRLLMGEIIRLGRIDRNQRLSRLGHSLGITDDAQLAVFIESTDRIFAETELDWASLFQR